MDDLRQDLAFAIRAIGRRPGFAVLAASMLALGIGANTAIFSVVNAVVLRPLSYLAPEELFFVGSLRGGRLQALSAPEFLALREEVRGFEVATAIDVNLNLVGRQPERVSGARATANLLPSSGDALSRPELPGRRERAKETAASFWFPGRSAGGSEPTLGSSAGR
jgi:hypothetical protein